MISHKVMCRKHIYKTKDHMFDFPLCGPQPIWPEVKFEVHGPVFHMEPYVRHEPFTTEPFDVGHLPRRVRRGNKHSFMKGRNKKHR
jgi:hypothetical protein